MIPGLAHDDRYRMVEDEFLGMAHQFTVHLHRAEYNRLKNLAKAQNAATISEIERPVVGTPTLLARQRRDRTRRVARQRSRGGLRNNDEQVNLPRAETTGLRGLLESPRKEAKWISAGAAGISSTRAAAGYGTKLSSPPRPPRRSPQPLAPAKKRRVEVMDDETTEGSDDDLSTPARPPARPAQVPSSVTSRSTVWTLSTPRAAVSSSTAHSPRPTPKPVRPDVTPVRARPAQATALSRQGDEENDNDDDNDDDDDDDIFGIKKRKLQRQKSRDQFRRVERTPHKEPSPDNIPSFM